MFVNNNTSPLFIVNSYDMDIKSENKTNENFDNVFPASNKHKKLDKSIVKIDKIKQTDK